eukprot:TRINITY_DN11989_c0_g1_i1.p1 TRINITY_DN11989_c0_g1~~TRINITY_DN11989_c0_g1_i1.p1  ORF type:complete len:398 (+),score=91.73 TRINITY_DN11989_c0_g1_i1:183-1376(+)
MKKSHSSIATSTSSVATAASQQTKGFGTPLIKGSTYLPDILELCVNFLLSPSTPTHVSREGLFRISAAQSAIDSVRIGLESKSSSLSFPPDTDTHIVACILKSWFRELPEPLCTWELYTPFIAAVDQYNITGDLQLIKKVLILLPTQNKIVLKFLVKFLVLVEREKADNKMTAGNLGVVFGPNLLVPQPGKWNGGTLRTMMECTPQSNRLLEIVILHADELIEDFPDPTTKSRKFVLKKEQVKLLREEDKKKKIDLLAVETSPDNNGGTMPSPRGGSTVWGGADSGKGSGSSKKSLFGGQRNKNNSSPEGTPQFLVNTEDVGKEENEKNENVEPMKRPVPLLGLGGKMVAGNRTLGMVSPRQVLGTRGAGVASERIKRTNSLPGSDNAELQLISTKK